jgi:hypothetical protein
MTSEHEIQERIDQLAAMLRQKGLAFPDSQAKDRAREIVMQEVKMQQSFDAMKDDPARNPQQRTGHVSPEVLKQSGGMLTGTELPQDVPLAELLKGKKK